LAFEGAANLIELGWFENLVHQMNAVMEISGTMRAYINAFTATDSYNAAAKKAMSTWEQSYVRMQQSTTRIRSWIGSLGALLPEILKLDEIARSHTFALEEIAEQGQYLMSEVEEQLAAEFVVEQFGTFSPELADFAQKAFEKKWVDAEMRDGKRVGSVYMPSIRSAAKLSSPNMENCWPPPARGLWPIWRPVSGSISVPKLFGKTA